MEQNNVPINATVILVHPCEVIRHSISLLLQQAGYLVSLSVDSLKSLLEKSNELDADLVLIHYSQYQPTGIIKQIIEQTNANMVSLASSDSYHQDHHQHILEQIAEGVTGFLDMNEPLHTFFSELEDIVAGDIVISKNFKSDISQNTIGIEKKLDKLCSQREAQILDLIGLGNTNKEIGEELYISEHTVKAHLRSILTKLNLRNRQQAIAYIIRKNSITEHHAGEK